MLPPQDDLISRAVQGDREALVDLLRRHGPAVRQQLAAHMPRRWRSVLSEDDVMQQTYADAATDIHRFDSKNEGSFARWLTMAARRNLRDAVKMLETEKRGGDRRQVKLAINDESFVALYGLVAVTSTTPSRHVARAEVKTVLKRAIEQLPEVYAQVVTMYDLESRPVQEVAEALSRSPGAVFMLRNRAHRQLRELMGSTSKYFGGSS